MESPRYFSAYIVSLVTGETIPLVTAPESLGESISANYNEQDILARSAPMIAYTSTGARKVTISMKLHEDVLPSGYNINSYINSLKSLVYPEYSGSGNLTPPSAKLMMGTSLNVIGVVNSVEVNWITDVYRDNRIPMASVSLTITETRQSCPGATTIKNGG